MSYTKHLKEHNVSYLGSVQQSAKLNASFRHGTLTYGLYLASADLSGYNVCPCSEHCKKHCLTGSGRVKIEQVYTDSNRITEARIRKTRWFFEDRETFMEVLVHEIRKARAKAVKEGLEFSVRLNCTSDISPEDFTYHGRTILEEFPDVQFYDYTKVWDRLQLTDKYSNYDLTFSYDGYNWEACTRALERGVRVAVVFLDHELPSTFEGIPVVSGNEYDMRYIDPAYSVIGLHYHRTANDYINKEYVEPETAFVVRPDDPRCA